MLAAGLQDHDPPEIYLTDVLLGDRTKTASVTMALEWARHHLRMKDLDQVSFIREFGTEVARVLKGYPEDEREECLARTMGLHRRQSLSVARVLEAAASRHAQDLISGVIPRGSLLRRLLSGTDGASALPAVDPRTLVPPPEYHLRSREDQTLNRAKLQTRTPRGAGHTSRTTGSRR